jgi:3-oxoadipate enol-lactonase
MRLEANRMRLEPNGITLAYHLDGPAAGRADAPVVMLSHSLATSAAMWGPQVEALSRNYRVLRYDTRGHGASDVPPGPYSLADMVADVRGLLAGLGIDKVYFVGLSMGGMIGELLALTHPESLLGVALCSTNARMTPDAPAIWEERMAVARTLGMEAHVEPTIGRWFTPAFVEEHPEVVDPVREMIRSTDPAGYAGCIEAIRHTAFLEQLCRLRMPALVVAGREDPGLPAAEAIHEQIPQSAMTVLSPATHLCNLEQPEAFNAALLGFLEKAEAARGAGRGST